MLPLQSEHVCGKRAGTGQEDPMRAPKQNAKSFRYTRQVDLCRLAVEGNKRGGQLCARRRAWTKPK
eukprot:scaffold105433_cov31-Tisochrysis_lutea.AAC.4